MVTFKVLILFPYISEDEFYIMLKLQFVLLFYFNVLILIDLSRRVVRHIIASECDIKFKSSEAEDNLLKSRAHIKHARYHEFPLILVEVL